MQAAEAGLQQAITLISGEAEESQGERKARLDRNHDGLIPIVQDIAALEEAKSEAKKNQSNTFCRPIRM